MKKLVLILLVVPLLAQSPYNGILQGLDYMTTEYALAHGAVEMNPIMKDIHPAAFAATKMAMLLLTTKMSKKERLIFNILYTLGVMNNFYVISRLGAK